MINLNKTVMTIIKTTAAALMDEGTPKAPKTKVKAIPVTPISAGTPTGMAFMPTTMEYPTITTSQSMV